MNRLKFGTSTMPTLQSQRPVLSYFFSFSLERLWKMDFPSSLGTFFPGPPAASGLSPTGE